MGPPSLSCIKFGGKATAGAQIIDGSKEELGQYNYCVFIILARIFCFSVCSDEEEFMCATSSYCLILPEHSFIDGVIRSNKRGQGGKRNSKEEELGGWTHFVGWQNQLDEE